MSLFGSRISGFFGGTSGGGGGGTFNPTTNYMPVNAGGVWGDSNILNYVGGDIYTSLVAGSVNPSDIFGLRVDLNYFGVYIGDFLNNIKGDYLVIDNQSEFIKTYMSNAEYGLFIDRTNNSYLGDFSALESFFQANNVIGTRYILARANNTGLRGTYATGITKIGDIDGQVNGNYWGIDDNNSELLATSTLLGTSGTSSSDRLKINIGGVDYLIVLETP